MQIDFLTQRHCELLDVMWECKSSKDLKEFLSCLSPEDVNTCLSLLELVVLAHIDEAVEQGYSLEEADLLLQKYMQ